MFRVNGCLMQYLKWENDQKPSYSSCIVIKPHNFKILRSLLRDRKIGDRALAFVPTVSKFYQPSRWNFFGLVIFRLAISFFFDTGRSFVSIIIAIVSNITVLSVIQCYYLIWIFYAYELWCQQRHLTSASHHLLPLRYQVFTRFVVLQEILYQPYFA